MKKKRVTRAKRRAQAGAWTLGSDRFAKISAVEGITLTRAMKARKADFTRNGLPADERRRTIIAKYSKH